MSLSLTDQMKFVGVVEYDSVSPVAMPITTEPTRSSAATGATDTGCPSFHAVWLESTAWLKVSMKILPVQLSGFGSVTSNFHTVPSASPMKNFCAMPPTSDG